MNHKRLCSGLLTALLAASPVSAGECPWVQLFDGATLDGWTPKIRGYAYGENFADTFRVEDGAITVSYDGYEDFGGRFGHLFYASPFSRYRLRLEYRIYGDAIPGTPDWAFRNSGVMYHALPPDTMPLEQEFPVSLEMQFLRGRGDGEPRPTGNLCTPNTNTVYRGKFDETHCIQSSSPTFDSDEWVTAELLVLGDERVVHMINGEEVLRFEKPTYGGPGQSVHNLDPALVGEPVTGGYIAVQAEGHPVQFRNIELVDLEGADADTLEVCRASTRAR